METKKNMYMLLLLLLLYRGHFDKTVIVLCLVEKLKKTRTYFNKVTNLLDFVIFF